MRISRERYAALYGPTVGDRVRLADTDLWLEVEEDRCVGGDEAVFGGGKTIRESMLQGVRVSGAPDPLQRSIRADLTLSVVASPASVEASVPQLANPGSRDVSQRVARDR